CALRRLYGRHARQDFGPVRRTCHWLAAHGQPAGSTALRPNSSSVEGNRMRQVSQVRRNGFTLIELLVVIAIIAILAAILFPVFAQAREKARQTTCTSNVKNLGLAVMMYAQDYDETYPPLWYQANDGHWPNTVRPYIGQGGSDATGKKWTKGIM